MCMLICPESRVFLLTYSLVIQFDKKKKSLLSRTLKEDSQDVAGVLPFGKAVELESC